MVSCFMEKAIGGGTLSNSLQSLLTFTATTYFPALAILAQNMEPVHAGTDLQPNRDR